MENTTLRAGFARVLVTPPMNMKIPGYFKTRLANGIITDLYLQCTAFDDGEQKAIIFSCDAIGSKEEATKLIRKKISERVGVEENCIYIHTTHTHTGFRIILPTDDDPVYSEFFPHLVQQFCDCAQFAFEDLKPCSFKIAKGTAENISFNRRYEMKDGTYKTNPKTGDPDLLRRAGPADESVQLLRILREGGKEILFINFGTHPDTIGGNKYCADWPGYLMDYVRGVFDQNVEVLVLNGAQGDVNHCDRFADVNKPYSGPIVAQRMARVITGGVLKIYDDAVEIPTGRIKGYTEKVHIGKNTFDPRNLPLATEINKHYQDFLKTGVKDEYLLDMNKRYIPHEDRYMRIPEAVRIVRDLDAPEFFELNISGLQIGKVGFIGIPGEPFVQIGLDVKEGSKLDMTMVTCLTNAGCGYFPTKDAFSVDGYECTTSPFASNCSELITNACLSIREQMENN